MFVCKSKICKQYEQRTFPIDSRCRERCYCCCKYFHRSISIIRKTWIIETDSGTYSYTMHGMNHTSPPSSSSSSSVTFVRNYSRVRRISFGCVSIIDFYFFFFDFLWTHFVWNAPRAHSRQYVYRYADRFMRSENRHPSHYTVWQLSG